MDIIKKVFNNKMIPLILHLFHGNGYVTDFKKKAELFNPFFVKPCSLISNICELPLNLHYKNELKYSKYTQEFKYSKFL